MNDRIVIKGAKEHNLKNIDIELPRNKLIVFTGLSGSGKSSLAFDTIYAEGQRRYAESLTAYARQFLGKLDKPNVEFIEGLSPTISIDQKTTNHNPRSTVGTVTEIYDYLRLLFARVGVPHCYKCGKEIKKQTIDQITDQILAFEQGSKIMLLAPIVRNKKGEYKKLLEGIKKNGYVRVRIDGTIFELDDLENIKLTKTKKHNIEVVVDRLIIKQENRNRLTDSIESASKLSGGLIIVSMPDTENEFIFSQNFSCPDCGVSIEEIEPRSFSFNNPNGACPKCLGLGFQMKFDPELCIPYPQLSISDGAINVVGWKSVSTENSITYNLLKALAKKFDFSLDDPFEDLYPEIQEMLLYGDKTNEPLIVEYVTKSGQKRSYEYKYDGLLEILQKRYKETTSEYMKKEYESLMTNITCPECQGKRLKKESLAVTLNDKNIFEVTQMPINVLADFIAELKLTPTQNLIAKQVLKELNARIKFLQNVGLNYLTLGRAASTLSGGESQRIRLATQIGSGLVGVLYILDEPSIGLHQHDNQKLIDSLVKLRDTGNTLIVVEHDHDTIKIADHVVDIGPGAGINGGEIIFSGPPEKLMTCEKSYTGAYLSGKSKIPIPSKHRKPKSFIKLIGASENNLKNLDVNIPVGVFTCVTGVSGSGKSTLINETLYKILACDLNYAKTKPGKYKSISGLDALNKVINIDQSPIGKTPRSNPATYTELFDLIRDIFSQTQEAKMRGYQKGRFSFNVKGGRCEACGGAGILKIEMQFLSDVYVPCDVCHGKRYNRETLEVHYKGKNIFEVLDMTVDEALIFFDSIPKIKTKLEALRDVGLSYIKLGQASTTLSGGEAQRVKLATELSKKSTGKTIYILDEPTTGLHTADVHKLTEILQKLTDNGNTVIVIEHNLDVIKTADHIIDLGPGGGNNGGQIIAEGTPEKVANTKNSYTGIYLKKLFDEENS